VTATSVESNPSEGQAGGPCVVGSEISVPLRQRPPASRSRSGVSSSAASCCSGNVMVPRTSSSAGGINITNVGGLDPDASQDFLEIATSS
jgi:hypothetical protein